MAAGAGEPMQCRRAAGQGPGKARTRGDLGTLAMVMSGLCGLGQGTIPVAASREHARHSLKLSRNPKS
ncbi:MAG TPA: hypothetical protein VFQ44_09850 [Streptosporangiaceae bacterium]|nr:hypothetical protein [Streptosporangiaceae bacterium]